MIYVFNVGLFLLSIIIFICKAKRNKSMHYVSIPLGLISITFCQVYVICSSNWFWTIYHFSSESRSFLLRFEVSLDSKLYFYYSNSIARRKEKENEKFSEENLWGSSGNIIKWYCEVHISKVFRTFSNTLDSPKVSLENTELLWLDIYLIPWNMHLAYMCFYFYPFLKNPSFVFYFPGVIWSQLNFLSNLIKWLYMYNLHTHLFKSFLYHLIAV